MEAFPADDRGEDIENVYIDSDQSSVHKTLEVSWRVSSDSFHLSCDLPDRPFTRRGVLSVVNSLYDPVGFASPVILGGRLLQREILQSHSEATQKTVDWDKALPEEFNVRWQEWLNSIRDLSELSVPRSFNPTDFGEIKTRIIHTFCDASDCAIGHVIYIQSINKNNEIHVAFVHGESKVAPKAASSMPRLELCAAVEAAYSTYHTIEELNQPPSEVRFYSDSNVVLAYLHNEERRFSKYITRRVQLIHKVSTSAQWQYIKTSENPADRATRSATTSQLLSSNWLRGPDFLWYERDEQRNSLALNSSAVLNNSNVSLPEEIISMSSAITRTVPSLFSNAFNRINRWLFLVNVAGRVIDTYLWLDKSRRRKGVSLALAESRSTFNSARDLLVRDAQSCSYIDILSASSKCDNLPVKHSLSNYRPMIDSEGVIRVDGRLKNVNLPFRIKHPVMLPYNHPICKIIANYYHAKCGHQGKHLTLGAIGEAGFFLEKSSKLLKSLISSCIICRKLRANVQTQIMADLPKDRLERVAPFTNTVVDIMGPWLISSGTSTRKTNRQYKVWAALFTCLVSRAVHIEVVQSLDTSTFMNALRRFFAIRGTCVLIRSDRGTNFVGTVNENLDFSSLCKDLNNGKCRWEFNPPHSSHFGGVWERKIGQIRRALDFSLLKLGSRTLTFDEMNTLLQEAAAIVNATPLWQISSDPNDPVPLSPSMLLTLRDSQSPACDEFASDDLLAYGKKRWRRVQSLADSFWSEWRSSYLQTLQVRQKWKFKTDSLKVRGFSIDQRQAGQTKSVAGRLNRRRERE